MQISVIVPVYNRCEAHRQTLLSLAEQSYPHDLYEVIVVDDGSTDDTGKMIQSLQPPYRLIYTWQPNQGRCAARNRGISQADGDLILFLDGDMIVTPDLLAEHVRSHRDNQRVLVRGRITLWPPLVTTPFIRYGLAPTDDVQHLVDQEGFLPFTQTLTGNLSVKQEHLTETGVFDEGLDAGYAWDDIDLGYRAHEAALRLRYNPAATSYHNDWVRTLEQHCKRIWLASKTIPLLFSKHPELRGQIGRYVDKESIAWAEDSPRLIARKLIRRVLSVDPVLFSLKIITKGLERCFPSPTLLHRCYWLIIGSYALRGYREGSRGIDA